VRTERRIRKGKGWRCAEHGEDEQFELHVISRFKKVGMVTE